MRSAAGNAPDAIAQRDSITANNTNSNSRVNSAMKELFTMRNKIVDEEEDDLFRGVPASTSSHGGKSKGAATVGKGDVTSVLNQFRDARSKELQAERELQRFEIKRMLSPPTVGGGGVGVGEPGEAEFDFGFDTTARNRFYADYSLEGEEAVVLEEQVTPGKGHSAQQQRAAEEGAGPAAATPSSAAQDMEDITPPPVNNSPGLAFYDFVRSPKEGGGKRHNTSGGGGGGTLIDSLAGEGSGEAAPTGPGGLLQQHKIGSFGSMLDMPDMSDDGQGRHVWKEQERLDPRSAGHEREQYLGGGDGGQEDADGDMDNYDDLDDNRPGGRGDGVGYAGDSLVSEPAVDRQALENTVRNQAMLYESSMQLGGAVSSWAVGGSVESLGVMNMPLGQVALGSIEKLDGGEEGSLERLANTGREGELGRSVTFKDADDVREFDKDPHEGEGSPGEMSDVDRGSQAFSRGSNLEEEGQEEDRYTPGAAPVYELPAEWTEEFDPDSDCKYYTNQATGQSQWEAPPMQRAAGDRLSAPLFSGEEEEEEDPPLRFPDNYGYPREAQEGDGILLYGSLDGTDAVDDAVAGTTDSASGSDMNGLGLGVEKGIFFGDEDEAENQSNDENGNAAQPVDVEQATYSQAEKGVTRKKKKTKAAPKTTESMSASSLPHRQALDEKPPRRKVEAQSYYSGKGNQKIISPGSSATQEPMSLEEPERKEPVAKKKSKGRPKSKGSTATSVSKNESFDTPMRASSPLTLMEPVAAAHLAGAIRALPESASKSPPSSPPSPSKIKLARSAAPVPQEEEVQPAEKAAVVDNSPVTITFMGEVITIGGPVVKTPDPAKVAALKEKKRLEALRLKEISRPTPDKSLKPVLVAKAATDCPNIPLDPVDEIQEACTSGAEDSFGLFDPATEKVRIVLRAQLLNDDRLRELLKKLPKQKKQYGRTELKVFRDNLDVLEPSAIVDSLFGGTSRAWKKAAMGPKNEIVEHAASEFEAKLPGSPVGVKAVPDVYAAVKAPNFPTKITSTYMSSAKGLGNNGEDSSNSAARNHSILSGQPVGPYSAQHFFRRFSTGFVCVAVDFYMCFVGTYDLSSGLYVPGLNFDPKPVSKAVSGTAVPNDTDLSAQPLKEKPSIRQANVLEVDFTRLPSNIFALVPVILDECTPTVAENANTEAKDRGDISPLLKGMVFDCCLYSSKPANKAELKEAEADISKTEQSVLIGEINGQEKAVTNALKYNPGGGDSVAARKITQKEKERMLMRHLAGLDANLNSDRASAANSLGPRDNVMWKQNINMMFERASNAAEKVKRRGSVVNISQNVFGTTPLGRREALIPFVLYRRSTLDKGWAWKTTKIVTRGVQSYDMDHILNTIMESMVKLNIKPIHSIHVEHCDNCENHAMTTRHTPGHYRKYFDDIKASLHKDVPQLVCTRNLQPMLTEEVFISGKNNTGRSVKKEARVGSFEVIMRPYCSSVSQVIYSKLATNTFPQSSDLVNVIQGYLHPKPILYQQQVTLDVIVYDKLYKQPVSDLDVVVYLIDINMAEGSADAQNLRGPKTSEIVPGLLEVTENDSDDSDEQESEFDPLSKDSSPGGKSNAAAEPLSPNSLAKAKANVHKTKAFQLQPRKTINKGGALRDVSHSIIQDPTFSALGSWGKRDVLAWLESHRVTTDVKFFAEQAGVTSGHAMITLVNEANLRKWGCTNKRVKDALLKDVARMRDSVLHDHPSVVGLSNHRIQHMLETSNMMKISTDLNSSVAPQSGLLEFGRGSEAQSKQLKKERMMQLEKDRANIGLNPTELLHAANSTHAKRLGRNMSIVPIADGKTSIIGMIRASLPQAGNYLVKVSSSSSITTWSNIISVGADAAGCQLLWAAKIAPQMGLVRVQVSEKVFSHVMACGTYTKNGLMVPFTNMGTLRQHILYIRYNQEKLDATSSIVGEMFLPVGSYFSNICGTVLHVKTSLYDRVRIGFRRFNRGSTSGESTDSTHTLKYLDNEEKILRLHNRVVIDATVKVQSCKRLLRRLRAVRLSSSLALGIRIRMVMRGYLKRARKRLIPRQVTRIQSAWRGYVAFRAYQNIKERLGKLQALAVYERRKNANKSWTLAVIFVQVYLKLTKKLQQRRIAKNIICALRIQCAYRRKLAYKKATFQRKLKTWSTLSMFVFKTKLLMKVLRRRKQKKLQLEDRFKEGLNCEVMQKEEIRMREYDSLLEQHIAFELLQEKKKVNEALRQIEMRKQALIIKENKAALKIQAFVRGCDVRNWQDLYLARSRGLVHTVYGHRPLRRRLYESDSDSAASAASYVTVPLEEDANLVKKTIHTVSSRFRAAKRTLSKFISQKLSKALKKELEEGRRNQYRRSRTHDPERFKERRRMSIMYKLPGYGNSESDTDDSDEKSLESDGPELSAFRKYIYKNDIITAAMKHKMMMAREHVKERVNSAAAATKKSLIALPGKIAEPLGKILEGGFKGLLVSTRYVGLAGVRNLRRAKKRIENTQLSTGELKRIGANAIRESVVFPKKMMVRSGLLQLRSSNMKYMTSQQQQQHAVTVLQSAYRGYRARTSLLLDIGYRNKLADLVRLGHEQELAKNRAEEAALVEKERLKAEAAALLAAQELASPKAKKRTEDAKKSLLNSATSGLKSIATGIVSGAGGLVKEVATIAKNSAAEYAVKKKIAVDRAMRRASATVGLNDALLQISGTLTHCPTIDRQWHIGVYPKGSIIGQGLIGTLRGINVGGSERDNVQPATAISDDEKRVQDEAVRSRDSDEHFRSVSAYPLDKQTFSATSFHAHLADLPRYHELEVVIFVETLGMSYTPPAGTLPNQPFNPESGPSINANTFFFAPAFFAQINLAGGAAFPASGGRMHAKLRPNPSVVGRLPGAKKLLSMDGLGVVISVMPVALPPTRFLRTFRGINRPAPCYPSSLVDAVLLDGCSLDWGARNGAASCVGSFRDRLLVATSSRGVACAVYEYANTGALVGKLNMGPLDRIRDITIIVSGSKHAACCSSNGTVMVHEYIRGGDSQRVDHAWGAPCFMSSNDLKHPVAAACMTSHAGMDLLFTAVKNGAINVILLDRGVCIRQYQNDTFCYPAHVTCMNVCALKLYIGLSDGTLIVVSLHEILEKGNIDSANKLASAQLSRERCFRPDIGGITCMCVVSGNSFLGFRDEDEIARLEGHKSRKNFKEVCLEGHLVLVGGDDKDPTVKVLQPQNKGMRLLSTLAGHSSAITSITADAAGRHFFTASAEDRKVLAWDGLTFLPERRMGDMYFRGMALADDCMLVITDRPPHVKFWKVREQDTVHMQPDSRAAVEAPVNSAVSLARAHLDHEASSYNITAIRGEEWCRSRLRNAPPQPDHHGKLNPIERSILEMLDPMQSQLVRERWLTQYLRVESIPSMRPKALLLEGSENAEPERKSMSRAKFRRAQQAIAHAEKMLSNTLPGSPQHHAAMKTLSKLATAGTEEGSEEGEDSPVAADVSILGTTFGNRGTINKAKGAVSPEMQRIINASKGKRGVMYGGGEGDDDENEDSDDDAVYGRLFPGISPEKDKEIEEDIKAHKSKSEEEKIFARRLHRHNKNPHFSDSDEERDDHIKYVKPKKLTKVQIREKAKEFAGTSRAWTIDMPDASSKGAKGLLSRLTSPKSKPVSTAVLLNTSPSPDGKGSPRLEMYYSGEEYEEDDAKVAIAKSTVSMWQKKSKNATKRREKNFFKGMVRELRDIDEDDA